MPRVRVETNIAAAPDACFDLARDVSVHPHTTKASRERVVTSSGSGSRLELGDVVTFEGTHFGFRLRQTACITRLEPPGLFEDSMTRGVFRRFVHLHEFQPRPRGHTCMVDTLDYAAPLWLLGRLADRLFLERYLREFLVTRASALRALAESEYSI